MSNGTKYSRIDQVKFVEIAFIKFEGICSAEIFKGWRLQILLGPLLNALD